MTAAYDPKNPEHNGIKVCGMNQDVFIVEKLWNAPQFFYIFSVKKIDGSMRVT